MIIPEPLQKYGDAASGDATKTMEWLERVYETHDPGLAAVKTKRDFSFLHDNPPFIALLEKMKLIV